MNQGIGTKILKYTFKALGLLLVFGTIGILLWRIFTSGDPAEMKALKVNARLVEAYEQAQAEGREMDMFTQEQPTTITTADHNYSYFSVSNTVFIKDADQVQLTFRYNNSTIRHLAEDYDLPEVPARDAELYEVSLWVVYDLTPDVAEDDENVEYVRFYPTAEETLTAQKSLYNYRKLVFDGVDFNVENKPILTIYMDVYYVEDVDYEKDPYGTLPLYQKVYETKKDLNKPYTLTDKERKALEAYA
ncbi:MAG: hypothetical protein E7661_08015 [Ruminococcaceae bacterium]|nr:hypothetical protein [Oscillospiraceae bacterium]